jgi:hypothetical protein
MYAVDTTGAAATAIVATPPVIDTVNAGGTLAPTLWTVQSMFPEAGAVPTVSVNSVPVVVAVPVVTSAVIMLPEDPAAVRTVGELPAAAPAAIAGTVPMLPSRE